MIYLLPVIVAVRFSAADNGYFYIAYTVGGTMEFIAINMASSLTATPRTTRAARRRRPGRAAADGPAAGPGRAGPGLFAP